MAAFLGGEEKADLALQTIENAIKVVEEVVEENDAEVEEDDQTFEDYETLHDRLNHTLYYGYKSSSTDRLSLAVTELSVDAFNHLGNLHEKIEKLDRLDMSRAAKVTKDTCANPTSLVLALMYLERLRSSNPSYLTTISSTDLFLISMMVASKYLHDDGEEDEVFNEEWAKSGGMEKKELNELEMEFLVAIDWRLHHSPQEFETMAKRLETAVVKKQLGYRKWNNVTYCDMVVLTRDLQVQTLWDLIVSLTLKMTAVFVTAYAASLMTMMGTCHMLNQVKLGPNAVSESVNTIFNSLEVQVSHNETPENSSTNATVPEMDIVQDDTFHDMCVCVGEPPVCVSNETIGVFLNPSVCISNKKSTPSRHPKIFNIGLPGKIRPNRHRLTKWGNHGLIAAPLAGKV